MKARRSSRMMLYVLIWLVALGFALPIRLASQSFYGSIVGTVTDNSGAVVPGATVTVTNLGTNEKRTAQSGAAGEYNFVNLVPASYRVDVEAKTFKHMVRGPIPVQVDNTVRIDVTLEVGAASETVTVTSQAPLLQTDSGTLSTEVQGQQVQEMPLNGRNTMNLISLVPGVVPQGSSQGTTSLNEAGHTSYWGWGNYQIGGAIAGQEAMFIDSVPLNVLGGNFVGLVPTQDAIQEFKVATSAVSAEFGRFGGGVVEMTTKSGGNRFHGSAYEYLRNKVLNANYFFNNRTGVPRQEWNQNQYGTVFSGPIKRDKAFFLFTWEGFASRLASPSPTNVPTDDMKNGIFAGEHLVDPTGLCNIAYDATTNTSTIPSSCIDKTANVIKNYWGTVNNPTNTVDNYLASPVEGDNQNQYNARVDYTISNKQRFFARYTYWTGTDKAPSEYNDANGFLTDPAHGVNHTHQAVLGDTYTFNPTTILDVRISYLRQYAASIPAALGEDLSQFGSNYANLEETYKVNPTPLLHGSHNLGSFQPMSRINMDLDNTYSLSGTLTKIISRHMVKFGGEARLMNHPGVGNFNTYGGFFDFYSNNFTGDEFANFLLGYATDGSITTASPITAYNWYQGYYVTDTWQIGRNLTLNLGVRWELPGALAEQNDKATVLQPTTTDPVTGAYGTLALVNSSQYKSRYTEPVKHDLFSPRIGFAYRLKNDMAVRGGYALTYLPPDLPLELLPYNSPINSATTTWINGTTPTHLLANPFPSGILQPSGRSSSTFMKGLLGQTIVSPIPTDKFPYMQQWNLSVSRQFKGDWMIEAGYAGSIEIHQPIPGQPGAAYSINELSSQYYSLGSSLLDPVTTGSSETLGQSLRPYPAYLDVQDAANFRGTQTYNALQLQTQKRFGSGGLLMASYTWAKIIGDTDTLNPDLEGPGGADIGSTGFVQDYNNPKSERSIMSYNIPQRLVISYVLDLPFGKGQQYAANLPTVANKLVSGWAVNGITTFQTGLPLTIAMEGNYLTEDFGGGTLRPNYVSGCKKKISGSATSRLNEWFNTSCFVSPGDFAFGNEPRVDGGLHAQGVDNFDFSVLKSTKIKELTNLQFRAEFFNIFNRVQFWLPGTVVDGGSFGKITQQTNQPRLVQVSLRLNF